MYKIKRTHDSAIAVCKRFECSNMVNIVDQYDNAAKIKYKIGKI